MDPYKLSEAGERVLLKKIRFRSDLKNLVHIITAALFLNPLCTMAQRAEAVAAAYYDEKNKVTVFSRQPYGSLSLPGKWTKVNYNEVSQQHFFQDADSVLLGLAINPAVDYPFYKKGMKANDLVQAMYQWDSNYFKENTGVEGEMLEQNLNQHFILWQIKGEVQDLKIDNYYLIGSEKEIVVTIFIKAEAWSGEKRAQLLRTVFQSRLLGPATK